MTTSTLHRSVQNLTKTISNPAAQSLILTRPNISGKVHVL